MNTFPTVFQYFMGTIGATMSGIIYAMAIENLQPVKGERRKFQKLWVVALLSVLITPLGAWLVSGILRARSVTRDIKDSDK